jgi:hypothetical protein
MSSNKSISLELENLIEEHIRKLLQVRALYMKIEDKAVKEEGFTEDSIAILLDQRYKEAINKPSTSTINNTTIASNVSTKKSNNLYTHIQ